jgi:hypothetical protein
MTDPLIDATVDYAQLLDARVRAGRCDELDALAYLAADALALAVEPTTSEATAAQLLDLAGQWAVQRRRRLLIERAAAMIQIPDDLSGLTD